MGKKVKVTTKCGEVFTYDHDQEVETVEIVEVPKFRHMDVFDKIDKLMKDICFGGIYHSRCNECPLDMDDNICVYITYRSAVGYNKTS